MCYKDAESYRNRRTFEQQNERMTLRANSVREDGIKRASLETANSSIWLQDMVVGGRWQGRLQN